VTKALEAIPGVTSAVVDLKSGTAVRRTALKIYQQMPDVPKRFRVPGV
jgi:copper chaperone CopZ